MKKIFLFLFLFIPLFCFATTTIDSTSTFQIEPAEIEIDFSSGPPIFLLGGSTIFEDDFNSYNNGNLVGQGSWTLAYGSAGDFQVQETTIYEGAKAVAVNPDTTTRGVKKTGTEVSDGTLGVYIRVSKNTDINAQLVVYDGATYVGAIYLVDDGNIKYLKGSPTAWLTYQAYIKDTWYWVQVEWRSSDKYVRYKVDDGAWTDWLPPYQAWTSAESVLLAAWNNAASGGTAYFDYIAEYPYGVPPPPVPYLQSTFFIFWFSFGEYFLAIWGVALFICVVVGLVYLTTRR